MAKKKDIPYPLKKKRSSKGTKSEQRKWVEKLDKVFSLYIRMRDSKQYGFKYFRCPTCGKILPFEKADCSHYFSRRHMNTRFDEDNAMAECAYDNRFNSEHLLGLGEGIKKRIGEQRFLLLRVKANNIRKWSVFELQAVYEYYAKKILEMKKEV